MSKLIELAQALTPAQVNAAKGKVTKAINKRIAHDDTLGKNTGSKDYVNFVKDWKGNESVARVFAVLESETGLTAEAFLMNAFMSEDELIKAGLYNATQTSNVKMLRKAAQICNVICTGAASRMEAVLKAFIFCAHHAQAVIDKSAEEGQRAFASRETVEAFLRSSKSADLTHVSQELADAVSKYRREVLSQGASTQTSQCSLVLGVFGAIQIERNGHSKQYSWNTSALVAEALTERFEIAA